MRVPLSLVFSSYKETPKEKGKKGTIGVLSLRFRAMNSAGNLASRSSSSLTLLVLSVGVGLRDFTRMTMQYHLETTMACIPPIPN